MKQFKFNEQAAIEAMMRANFVDKSNIVNTIYSLAKYNHHALHLNDQENYNRTLQYIMRNCENMYEEAIYRDIVGCIKNAKKHSLATINEVCITKSEIDIIRGLGDIKQEKAIFVILAVSKYFNALNSKDYDAVFLSNADICKMSRITIPSGERDKFMQFAYDKGLLYRHTWADSIIKKVTFVSHDENDEIVLKLGEGDFKDLAYTYLAYLTPSKFKRCFRCKKWIRNKSKGNQLCKECIEDSICKNNDTIKTLQCIDCGASVYVSVFDTETCRCEECNKTYQKERNAKKNKAYRERHKAKA